VRPSILADVSGAVWRLVWLWNGGGELFPRMDGGRTWRAAGICGVIAIRSGLPPYTLGNMMPPELLVMGEGFYLRWV